MRRTDTESLFRRQAIESLARPADGRPIGTAPRSWLWSGLLVGALFASLVCFVFLAEFTRTEGVRGWLVSTNGIARIASTEDAVITRIVPRAGDTVEAGTAVVFLRSDADLASGLGSSVSQLAALQHELDELQAQSGLLQRQAGADRKSVQRQLRDFDDELQMLAAERADLGRRSSVFEEQLARLESAAASGAASHWEILQQRQAVLSLAQQSARLEQLATQRRREREALRGVLETAPLDAERQNSLLRERRARLEREIVRLETRKGSVLKAPVTGIVATVAAQAGDTVRPGQGLMTVLPLDSQLQAELFVPSRAIGMVERGQAVRLNYDAFPGRVFGTFEGRVARISDYVLLPAEIPPTFPIGEASYKVQVRIEQHEVMTASGQWPLRPGMLLGAEIRLERRRLVDWLLEPLRAARLSDT